MKNKHLMKALIAFMRQLEHRRKYRKYKKLYAGLSASDQKVCDLARDHFMMQVENMFKGNDAIIPFAHRWNALNEDVAERISPTLSAYLRFLFPPVFINWTTEPTEEISEEVSLWLKGAKKAQNSF